MKKIITLIVIVVVAVLLLNRYRSNPKTDNSKISVVATFYPLADFVKNIGDDLVTVTNITPAGAEPHDYEPSPQDIAAVYNAKIFIMNGGGVDTWAEKIKVDLKNRGIYVVDMEDSIQLSQAPQGAETVLDPHLWLDPVLAKQEVELISSAFMIVDPEHRDVYKKNADEYIAKLEHLDTKYQTGLANCQTRDIVTSHAAFGYLARRYNLNQIAITGLSPDAEPSAQELAEVAKLAKEKNIKYIFFETLVSPKLSQTIATEVGAQTIAFNPIEGLTDDEIKAGKNYLSEMEGNLQALRTALQCK